MSTGKRREQSPRTSDAQKDITSRTAKDLRTVSGRNLANLAIGRKRPENKEQASIPQRPEAS